MVYIRRYLSGQQATTVTIAEGAITSDKIVDGAVTHPKLAPGSVDSERVINESLKSEDIKDGEIKTVDIASGAVTTDKIAPQAVTVDKLEASIQGIARPLTPGVASEEIAALAVVESKIGAQAVASAKIKDGAVSAVKIGADAVEEVKIKDGAVSTAKLAGGAVTETKIGLNAVTGPKIAPGVVSVTELADNAVEAAKIKDLNVSEPKINNDAVITRTILDEAVTAPKLNVAALTRRHLRSFDVRIDRYYDQFKGSGEFNKWRKRVDAGGIVYYVASSDYAGIMMSTPATTGKKVTLDWDGHGTQPLWGETSVLFKVLPTTKDYHTRELGLVYAFDKSQYILFTAEDAVGGTPNWFARCKRLGTETVEDTGIAVADVPQRLKIEYLSGNEVKFYIDGDLVKTITTNVPGEYNLDPWMSVIARSNAARSLWVEMMSLIQERAV